ncbi:MAG: hypothetical protein ABIS50_13625 [Luteolibacter sp.]|uniref:hypothetical protein n=1 Tax=Luteolibacter sp. TaxID=1962973 RepID=UPI0032655B80
MTRNHKLLLALSFIGLFVVGWSLGGNSGKSSVVEIAPPSLPPRSERHSRTRSGPAGEAAQRLDAIRAIRNPAERLRATIDLASTIPPADFAAWLDGGWFTLREGMDSVLFNSILMERWQQADPEAFIVWGTQNGSGEAYTLLASWAEHEPQRVLDLFKRHPNDHDEMRALSEIAEKNPDLALRRLQEMITAGIGPNGTSYAEELTRELAKQSPAALEAALDSLPGKIKLQAERFLIGGKMKTDYAGELRKLWDRPDGLKLMDSILRDDDSLRSKLADELADFPSAWRKSLVSNSADFIDGKSAEKWLKADLEGCGFTAEEQQKIHFKALVSMVSEDPEAVLRQMTGFNLPAEDQQALIRNVFNYRNKEEPEKNEALIALLGSDEDRETARKLMEPEEDSPEIPIENPTEWLEKVAALDPEKDPTYKYLSMLGKWDADKLAALSTQFNSMPDSKKRVLAQAIVGNSYLSDHLAIKAEAVRYLVANPLKTTADSSITIDEDRQKLNGIRLASQYVEEMAQTDPEGTGQWIQSLPAGDAKLWAAKNLQSLWSVYDPEAAKQWFNSLPANIRSQVQSLVSKHED